MKKLLAILLSLLIMIAALTFVGSAIGSPFEFGTYGSDFYRIPALITLNDGRQLAAADMRYIHGSDSPQNIDTLCAVSGENGWEYSVINYYNDCAHKSQNADSASFIDTALLQSKVTDDVFALTTMFPSGYGYAKAVEGTGFKLIDGKKRLMLKAGEVSNSIDDYDLYVGDFEGDFAKVIGADKNYTVDRAYNIYLDGAPVLMKQLDGEDEVAQNVFFYSSVFHVFPTCYLAMKKSSDGGKTWGDIKILSENLKYDDETFFGVCPGRGATTLVDGKERLLFTCYDNQNGEASSVIYSDDNGETWQRGQRVKATVSVGKTSESQIINVPDGSLMMFSRNSCGFVSTSKSTDGGVTWSKSREDLGLKYCGNCMVSFINYTSKKINGKDVVIGSYPSALGKRANGVIRVGLMNKSGRITWISTYRINDGFFAYSCLTELPDGKIACLYEDEPAHINYGVFELTDKGKIVKADEDGSDTTEELTFFEKIEKFFKDIFDKFLELFKNIADC